MSESFQFQDEQKITLCVSGASETTHCGKDAMHKAFLLGEHIAHHKCVAVSSTTTGFPLWVIKQAQSLGSLTLGFSPAANIHEHDSVYRLPRKFFDTIVYTGFGYAGAEMIMTRSSDGIIFGCGRIQSVHDFTVAFQAKKPIGILTGDWDTDDLLKEIISHDIERSHDNIFFDTDPKRLIDQLVAYIHKQRNK